MGERYIKINGTNEVLVEANPTGDRTIILPDMSGMIAIASAIPGAIAAGSQTGSTGTILFNNGNNITFGMDASSVITASASFVAQTNQTLGFYASGNQTLTSSGTIDARSFSIRGVGIVSVGYSANEIIFSATQSNQAFSAGAAASNFQTLVFQDSNGFSFSNNAGSVRVTHDLQFTSATSAITSAAVHTSAARIQGVIGSNTTYTSGSVGFRDLNGITWQSTTGQSFQITHALQYTSATSAITASALNTSQSSLFQHTSATSAITSNAVHTSAARIQGIIGSNTTYTSGSVGLRDLNGITWQSTTGQSFQITHDLQYTSATSAITSAALHTSASRVFNIIAATNSNGGGTASLSSNVSFSATNGVTFYTSAGGAIVGSVVTSYRASNDAIGLNTAQSNVTWTVNSAGFSLDARGYAGTGTTFNKTNVTGAMTLNSNGLRLDIEVAAPGAAAENNWFNLLGDNTAGDTTASGSTIGLSGINVTLSGANNSQIVISGPSMYTASGWNPYEDLAGTFTTNQASLMFDAIDFPSPVQFDRYYFVMNNTNSSNSSGSHTVSVWLGIYTNNASTLSLLASASRSMAMTFAGTGGSYSLHSGMRIVTVGMTSTLTEGRYWLGFVSRTSSAAANGSYSILVASALGSNFLGHFGSSHNTTMQVLLGQGVYTATTNGIPNSVGFNQIRGSDAAVMRPAYIVFASGTV